MLLFFHCVPLVFASICYINFSAHSLALIATHLMLQHFCLHFVYCHWITQSLWFGVCTGMRGHGTSPTRPNCCEMDWSEQAGGTWLRGCAASTGVTRIWAVGWSCPLPSPSSSLSTRPSTTKTGYAGSMTSTANTIKRKRRREGLPKQ